MKHSTILEDIVKHLIISIILISLVVHTGVLFGGSANPSGGGNKFDIKKTTALISPGNHGGFFSFAFSPDGKFVAGGTGVIKDAQSGKVVGGGETVLWDASSGRLVKTLGSHGEGVTWVAFSRDGAKLASVSEENRLFKLWSIPSGRIILSRPLPIAEGDELRLILGPFGSNIVIVVKKQAQAGAPSENEALIWDVMTGNVKWKLPRSNSSMVALSPDGSTLAAYIIIFKDRKFVSQEILICNAQTGQVMRKIDPGSDSPSDALGFLPDGKTLVGLANQDVILWNVSKGELKRKMQTELDSSFKTLAFSSDGKMLALASFMGDAIEVLDIAEGRQKGTISFKFPNTIRHAAFSADLSRIACDQREPSILDLAGMEQLKVTPPSRTYSRTEIPSNKTNEKIQYQMRFEAGEKYYLRFITDQTISQTITGQEQNIEQTIGLGYDFDVKNVEPNGNAWVSYTYRWAKFIQKGVGGQLTYDSSEKALTIPPMAQGFAALLDETFSMKITPQGRVEEVEGLQTVRNNIGKKIPEGPMKEAMMMGLKQFINEEGIKEQTENSMAIYPEKPVGIGDSWRKTIALTQGTAITLENEFILKDRKNGISFIEVKSDIKSNPKAEPMKMGTTNISYDLSGKQQGLLEIEESTGRLISSKTNQDASGQIKVEVTGQQSQVTQIPVKIDSVVTCEMTERIEEKTILDTNKQVVVNDTRAIRETIKAFEDLEEELANVEEQSDKEITEWINGLEGITTDIIKAVYEQIGAEYEFVRKQAEEENADKTTTTIDGVILYRSERFSKIAEKIQEEEIRREAMESRRGSRSRRSPRGRMGTRDSGYNSGYNDGGRYQGITRRSRRSRSRQDLTSRPSLTKVTIKLPFTDPNTVKAKLKTFEGLEKELRTIDRMGIREMRGWTSKQNASTPMLAKSVYLQVTAELDFAKKIAIEENASKTTMVIDGLLVKRNERLDKISKRMVEEKRRLRQEESRTNRTRTRR
jgi:WD40 repeat protein